MTQITSKGLEKIGTFTLPNTKLRRQQEATWAYTMNQTYTQPCTHLPLPNNPKTKHTVSPLKMKTCEARLSLFGSWPQPLSRSLSPFSLSRLLLLWLLCNYTLNMLRKPNCYLYLYIGMVAQSKHGIPCLCVWLCACVLCMCVGCCGLTVARLAGWLLCMGDGGCCHRTLSHSWYTVLMGRNTRRERG